MLMKWRTARVTACLLILAALLSSCRSGGERGAAPKPVSDIYFMDRVSASIPVEESETGYKATNTALVGQLLLNKRSTPVRITHVEPVVETGLRVTYLGHSTCDNGCPGAIRGDDEAMWVARLDGQYPIELPPNKRDDTLVFRIEADGAQGAEHLVSDCHLHLWKMVMTLDNGERIEVGYSGGTNDWVMRAHLGEPQPEGAAPKCRDAQSINPGPSS
jgi:hypothetical protein